MTRRQTMTRDIGFAIRDFCDCATISHVDEDGKERHGEDEIKGIDISDPDNPIFYMESGAVFTVRIVRTG
ncbi:hypothetical protein [Bradyrhizobium lablabi]|uniref:hypothetical protein n=1 Tax=Bradyrhizobium lablabi TaxID=722472 RepID=UPI001BA84477|nr:hypothetical protein [Bradyrhizobium lablabi]MBR0693630.1 hypothetical protein [Bradyrhizobium lablabi]